MFLDPRLITQALRRLRADWSRPPGCLSPANYRNRGQITRQKKHKRRFWESKGVGEREKKWGNPDTRLGAHTCAPRNPGKATPDEGGETGRERREGQAKRESNRFLDPPSLFYFISIFFFALLPAEPKWKAPADWPPGSFNKQKLLLCFLSPPPLPPGKSGKVTHCSKTGGCPLLFPASPPSWANSTETSSLPQLP